MPPASYSAVCFSQPRISPLPRLPHCSIHNPYRRGTTTNSTKTIERLGSHVVDPLATSVWDASKSHFTKPCFRPHLGWWNGCHYIWKLISTCYNMFRFFCAHLLWLYRKPLSFGPSNTSQKTGPESEDTQSFLSLVSGSCCAHIGFMNLYSPPKKTSVSVDLPKTHNIWNTYDSLGFIGNTVLG